jgi:3-hydroxyisobutyrate dehydrogenase-like beta-hydroxyacid dehydrogenase
MISGDSKGRYVAAKILGSLGKVVDYGDDVGAANVVKLCGNFLIAVSGNFVVHSFVL